MVDKKKIRTEENGTADIPLGLKPSFDQILNLKLGHLKIHCKLIRQKTSPVSVATYRQRSVPNPIIQDQINAAPETNPTRLRGRPLRHAT